MREGGNKGEKEGGRERGKKGEKEGGREGEGERKGRKKGGKKREKEERKERREEGREGGYVVHTETQGRPCNDTLIPCSRGKLSAALTASFAMPTMILDRPEIFSPSFTASPTTSSGGSTLLTSPALSASWADMRSPG